MGDKFEGWFKDLDVHKIEPYTTIDNEYQIETFLRIAFEAGHNSCIDGLIEGSDSPDYVEWRSEDLLGIKYD